MKLSFPIPSLLLGIFLVREKTSIIPDPLGLASLAHLWGLVRQAAANNMCRVTGPCCARLVVPDPLSTTSVTGRRPCGPVSLSGHNENHLIWVNWSLIAHLELSLATAYAVQPPLRTIWEPSDLVYIQKEAGRENWDVGPWTRLEHITAVYV